MRVRILPYKAGSASARALSQAMGVRRLRTERSTFNVRPTDVIINWGNAAPPFTIGVDPIARCRLYAGLWLNHPNRVKEALCKLTSLIFFREAGVPHPEFTSNWEVAHSWLGDGATVVARTLLRASGGRGLVLVQPGEDLPVAGLYTRYVKKRTEYRIHVGKLEGDNYVIIDAQEKRRRSGVAHVHQQVRNAANGWVYCREAVTPPEDAIGAAVRSVDALGLDFGAVDLGWNSHSRMATVYEVNTAPGLDGTSPDRYARYFADRLGTGLRG